MKMEEDLNKSGSVNAWEKMKHQKNSIFSYTFIEFYSCVFYMKIYLSSYFGCLKAEYDRRVEPNFKINSKWSYSLQVEVQVK